MPEATLKALIDHGEIGQTLPVHAHSCDEVLAKFAKAGIDTDGLAARLQEEGAQSFVKSWNDLMECIASKSKALNKRETEGRTQEEMSLTHNANQKRMNRDEEDRDLIVD
jgi:hypothetical protein